MILSTKLGKPQPFLLRLRFVHGMSAAIILSFLILHLVNHLVGLSGQTQHVEFMAAIRPFYRNQVVEPLILAQFGFQVLSGLTMVVGGWRRRSGVVAWLQAGSGLYLGAFLLNHVSSILYGRAALHLDTDFRFAAAGFHVPGLAWFFAPYYFLAIVALFTHVGCAAFWFLRPRSEHVGLAVLLSLGGTGIVFGALVVAGLWGWLYPVDIPANYLRTYQ